MSMNLGSHMMSHYEMFKHLIDGDDDERRRDQGVLRRIPRGLRHDRRILPPDGRRGVPDAFPAQGRRSSIAASRSISARSPTPRCCASRASATTSRASARPGPRSTSHRTRRVEEEVPPGRGRRPLRHLQRQPLARQDRPGGRGILCQARREETSLKAVAVRKASGAAQCSRALSPRPKIRRITRRASNSSQIVSASSTTAIPPAA